MLNNIKQFVRKAQVAYKAGVESQSLRFLSKVGEIQGIQILVDDVVFKMQFGEMPKFPCACAIIEANQIILPPNYKEWNGRHTDAVIAHEIGHIRLKHQYTPAINMLRNMGLSKEAVRMELEADAYAASLGYAHPLIEVLRLLPSNKEIQIRTEALYKL